MNPGQQAMQDMQRSMELNRQMADQARRSHQQFVDQSTRQAAEFNRRMMEQSQYRRSSGGGLVSGLLGFLIRLLILGIIVGGAFLYLSGQLPI
jgi:hypothetical protein